jgi:hypothetical protein
MCEKHMTQHGRGLGLGRGQRLILAEPKPAEPEPFTIGGRVLAFKTKDEEESLQDWEDRLELEDYL